ncbi:hypothetical protein RIF29_21288 [Crotalaria pallida]|uniref:Uncharacterized protein n=1 Tax=Crotalaria pallida TaxID=3830 RepID=A0AAN9F2R2_CROPI
MISSLVENDQKFAQQDSEKRGKEKKDKNKVKVGLPYDLKPEFALSEEEYDSASSEEDYGSSYGLKPEFASSKEDYGVGYGRKSKFVSHEKEYGSGYPKLQNNASGYGRKQEKGYGSGYPKKYDNSRGRY